ncbi:hypothetical protein Tco_0825282 [Tanacetum coccineum]
MTPYTTYHDIQGIIYEDDINKNRLMRTNELHKFSDGTLNHVHTALNDIATGLQMDYLPKRKWSKQDKQRARVMINAIDKKLKDRRLMRNMEKFIGGRPYGGDLRLLEKDHMIYHMMFSYLSDVSIDFQIDFSIQLVRPHLAGLLIPCCLLLDAPVMRTASAAAKPCQGDSSEFYLITSSVLLTIGAADP